MAEAQEPSFTIAFTTSAAEHVISNRITIEPKLVAFQALADKARARLAENDDPRVSSPVVLLRHAGSRLDGSDGLQPRFVLSPDGRLLAVESDLMPNYSVTMYRWTEKEAKSRFWRTLRDRVYPENYGARQGYRGRIAGLLGGGALLAAGGIAVGVPESTGITETARYGGVALMILGVLTLAASFISGQTNRPSWIFARKEQSPLKIGSRTTYY